MFKRLLIFEWIVPLCERHRAGVEPHVNELRNPFHGATAAAFQDDIVDIGAMEIQRIRKLRSFSAQFFHASHGSFGVAALADPDWNRRAPISIAGDSPVLVLLEPVSEAPFAGFR